MPTYPDLQPDNERSALSQRLDQYRALAVDAVVDLSWTRASARLLPATDLTIEGVVKHKNGFCKHCFTSRKLL